VLRDTVIGALHYWMVSAILEGSLAQGMSLTI